MIRSGENLILDLNKITNFIFGDEDKRSNEVEITEKLSYDESGKMVPESREVKELKLNDNTAQITVRYDLIKVFLELIDSIEDPSMLTLSQELTLNTMEAYGLVKDLKEVEDE